MARCFGSTSVVASPRRNPHAAALYPRQLPAARPRPRSRRVASAPARRAAALDHDRFAAVDRIEAPRATREQLLRVHTHDGETDVIIVGAGPVGLAAAIELGRRGIRCVVVERNDRVGYSPRAKTTNVRTREHLRRWGIADELRRASPIAPDRPSQPLYSRRA